VTPAEVLAGIESFANATIVAELAGGPASDSYLVERGAQRFVLRIDNEVAAALGLERASEAKILEYVSQYGLGPTPEFIDPERGIVVTRYIEGRAWTDADLHDRDRIRKLAALLRTLHALKPVGPCFDLQVKIENYARIIDSAEGRELANDTQCRLRELQSSSATQCLCHNDLVCTNIVEGQGGEGQGLTLIDWEYAAIGDPFFDLASVAEHHHFDQQESHRLLTAYFGRESAVDAERLIRYRVLYVNLTLLWLASVERLTVY